MGTSDNIPKCQRAGQSWKRFPQALRFLNAGAGGRDARAARLFQEKHWKGRVFKCPALPKDGSLRQPFPYHRGKAAPTLFMFQSPGLGMPGDGAPDGQACYPGKKENGQPSQGGSQSQFLIPGSFSGAAGEDDNSNWGKNTDLPPPKRGLPGKLSSLTEKQNAFTRFHLYK